MQEFTFTIQEALAKGLRPTAKERRNTPWLIALAGGFPSGGVLHSFDKPQQLLLPPGMHEQWPFPQLFKLRTRFLLCGGQKIYEMQDVDGPHTLVYTAPSHRHTWSVADFGEFLVMTNGVVVVARDPANGVYSERTDLPKCMCVSAYNGQLIFGGMNMEIFA